ncbi:hypothetical protein EV361DRAFT_866556 [Lentinula raphanica]|nr:hypothetical protein EV361DRAFT_866556 [Lentinula raphanica]
MRIRPKLNQQTRPIFCLAKFSAETSRNFSSLCTTSELNLSPSLGIAREKRAVGGRIWHGSLGGLVKRDLGWDLDLGKFPGRISRVQRKRPFEESEMSMKSARKSLQASGLRLTTSTSPDPDPCLQLSHRLAMEDRCGSIVFVFIVVVHCELLSDAMGRGDDSVSRVSLFDTSHTSKIQKSSSTLSLFLLTSTIRDPLATTISAFGIWHLLVWHALNGCLEHPYLVGNPRTNFMYISNKQFDNKLVSSARTPVHSSFPTSICHTNFQLHILSSRSHLSFGLQRVRLLGRIGGGLIRGGGGGGVVYPELELAGVVRFSHTETPKQD